MVISMTDRSLSSLYRRLNAQSHAGVAGLFDADTLVAAAAGTLSGDRRDEVAARLSRSPLQTDLVRMLRELTPASEALVQGLGERQVAAHTRNGRGFRHAAVAQRRQAVGLRWAGLAACLAVAIGVVSWHQHGVHSQEAAIAAAMEAAARPDRIFTSNDRIFSAKLEHAARGGEDSLFHSSFNGG
jgi:hypothetical protein